MDVSTVGVSKEFFNDDFFQKVVASKGSLVSWSEREVDNSTSILCTMASNGAKKLIGHFGFNIIYKSKEEPTTDQNLVVMVKSKATEAEILDTLNMAAQACGTADLTEQYGKLRWNTEFMRLDTREVQLVNHFSKEPRFTDIVPEMYYYLDEPQKEIFVLAMEFLEDVSHFNSAETAHEVWTSKDIEAALRAIAGFHSVHLTERGPVLDVPWLVSYSSCKMSKMKPLWKALLTHNRKTFTDLWTPRRASIVENVIENAEFIWKSFEESPRALIHNDFNPRNVCMRKESPTGKEEGKHVCVYDWELATIHVPQYDVAEFLAFTLAPEVAPAVRQRFLKYYQDCLEEETGKRFDPDRFLEVFHLACCDLSMNRLAMYSMVHTTSPFSFLPRVLNSHLGYLEQLAFNGQLRFGSHNNNSKN